LGKVEDCFKEDGDTLVIDVSQVIKSYKEICLKLPVGEFRIGTKDLISRLLFRM